MHSITNAISRHVYCTHPFTILNFSTVFGATESNVIYACVRAVRFMHPLAKCIWYYSKEICNTSFFCINSLNKVQKETTIYQIQYCKTGKTYHFAMLTFYKCKQLNRFFISPGVRVFRDSVSSSCSRSFVCLSLPFLNVYNYNNCNIYFSLPLSIQLLVPFRQLIERLFSYLSNCFDHVRFPNLHIRLFQEGLFILEPNNHFRKNSKLQSY